MIGKIDRGDADGVPNATNAEYQRPPQPVRTVNALPLTEYEQALFLSPHHDDVCFSLAGIALTRESGALVNIFTRSEYVARQMPLPAERNERIAFVTRLRTAEDQRFAEAAGLARHDLALGEPSLRGVTPFDGRDLAGEVPAVQSMLVSFLERYFEPEGRAPTAAIFCPMGIGGHRDHLLTLLAVKEMMTVLLRRFHVFFYEDLHYASASSARKAGIARALAILSGLQMSRNRFSLSQALFARKLELLAVYDSQFESSPRAADFIPADAETPTPHEAIWSCAAS
jgi:hypothetical protein